MRKKGFLEIAGDLSNEEILTYFRDFSVEIRKVIQQR